MAGKTVYLSEDNKKLLEKLKMTPTDAIKEWANLYTYLTVEGIQLRIEALETEKLTTIAGIDEEIGALKLKLAEISQKKQEAEGVKKTSKKRQRKGK